MRERDNQRSKVYTWEKSGEMASFWKKDLSITPAEACAFVRKILRECDHPNWSSYRIEFGKRTNNACANRFFVNFDPKYLPPIIVIHEMAHALTLGTKDFAGHGPNYMSCYMALLEKYLGLNIFDMAKSLQKKIPVNTTVLIESKVPVPGAGIWTTKITSTVKTRYVSPPSFNPTELKYWREITGMANNV